ncbi:hypothetical protein D1AOALGA4SA_8789 [Olavius algarvensis Delta 1 endosymbiont]|nr:hypothetical protein D1AOALGA4SA_8789 [Olavius algarvensis Delta 1 endosymbiont]
MTKPSVIQIGSRQGVIERSMFNVQKFLIDETGRLFSGRWADTRNLTPET